MSKVTKVTDTERLASVESHTENLEMRLGNVEKTLAAHSGKLDDIISAVSTRRDFNPMQVLQFIMYSLAIIGAFSSATIYISTAVSDSRLAVIEFKAENVWNSGKWVPDRSGIGVDNVGSGR